MHITTVSDKKYGLELGATDEPNSVAGWQFARSLFAPRISKRSLLIAFRQLSLLVETGIDVAEALELVAESCPPGPLKDSFEAVFEDISQGNSLSAAVLAQEHVLGREVAASVQAGEASGRLVEVLRQTASQLEEELQLGSTIRGALAYPIILGMAAMGVAAILIWFVLPQFEDSFQSMGVSPPLLTEVLLEGARQIRGNIGWITAALIAGALILATLLSQSQTKQWIHRAAFVLPVIGPTLSQLTIGRLFVRLGHLLCNGISLLDAIQLVRNSSSGGLVDRLTASWENDVVEGKGLTQNLDEFDFLPEGAAAMLVMAERTGKLESVLTTAGTHYRNEGSQQLKSILKLSEPVIIIVLGIFVGVVVASVLLPILDVQSAGQTA